MEGGASSRWREVSREKHEEGLGMKCEGGIKRRVKIKN
jgi:hypothetical protein